MVCCSGRSQTRTRAGRAFGRVVPVGLDGAVDVALAVAVAVDWRTRGGQKEEEDKGPHPQCLRPAPIHRHRVVLLPRTCAGAGASNTQQQHT